MADPHSIVSHIGDLAQSGERMIERLRRKAFLPESRKGLNVRFGIAEAAQLLGCSTNRIRMAEDDGRLPPPPAGDNGRRLGYTVEDLLNMRSVLGASPYRSADDEPAIIAVQNFKGGVGKSTVTTHLAHYFAVQGYRVLVVDCDSQATTTTLFGFNPHFNITREETLYPYLSIDPTQADLLYAVKQTPWPNVDLIPSNLELFDVEYELAAAGADGQSVLAARFRKLKQGLMDLARDYDVVILDPPPALGTISLAVMQAANALLVPLAATTPDFCSTVQFLSMMDQVLEQLIEAGIAVDYQFVRLICSKFDANDPSHDMVRAIMEQSFGPSLLPVPILESAEISHAALRMMTVYELEKPIGTPRTHKRCRANLDEALGQVEQLVRNGWGRVDEVDEELVVNG
ncbi:AAA family ATPase (plasmid) [Qipengyuania citrea]|jgi:chromosome partitioning protein|uniref:AAA family ATPase n=1 Tax=Qipengyuania citrea TaxID=225971 RepID=A0ABY4UB64_9SPHN|nr:AAA family ATPase [Qipengyuania citrea]MAC13005.1 chromosome partitioning protein [Sphingorhabdus sp.]PZT88189.1 MAG: chromosome partitioning protein [Citromicrobium sp.]USA63291.1 AAA family ATPase [Qipengyuania citrea]HCB79149.1 chromosome partitioning protein [Erythrobacter sp.]|tara:strand:+ start:4036 stop:5238 length:1203 start_codon:yes stop_codon:yes gene_type:complete